MARPRRATIETWYDVFADMDLADQAAAIRVLEQVHRLAKRDSERRTDPGIVDNEPTAPLLDEV